MSITTLSPHQLRQAADLKERIDALQDQLSDILAGKVSAPVVRETPPAPKTGRRKMSAEGRARIAAAQRARWAARRGEAKLKPKDALPGKPKRKMSAAAKARLSAAAKARWEKAKAAGKSRL
jgi:hypothetical protein